MDFYQQLDSNRQVTGAIPQATIIYDVVLAAGVMQTITVPSGQDMVLFSTDADFWCRFDADVAVPAATDTTGLGGEFSPESRVVKGVTTIRLISAVGANMSLAFYVIPGTNHMVWSGNAPA